MWIVFKLSVALLAFVIRYSRVSFRRPKGTLEGSPYFLVEERTRSGNVNRTELGVPFSFPALFSFHFEDGKDGFFKKLGLSHEFQTGDHEFDRKIYIASDNSGLNQILAEVDELRTLIVEVLGGEHFGRLAQLRFDGSKLWIRFPGQISDVEGTVRNLIRLKTLLLSGRDSVIPFWKDRFFVKYLLVESTIWSLAGYSCVGFFESMFQPEYEPLRWEMLILYSCIASAVLIAVFLFTVATLLRGSSRAHRVMVESASVLILSIPIAAFSGFTDLNCALDAGPGIVEQLDVQRVEMKRHRGRRGRTRYSYHVYLLPQNGTSSIAVGEGGWLEVSLDRYNAAVRANRAVMVIGPGRLGVPWIREVEFTNRPPSP